MLCYDILCYFYFMICMYVTLCYVMSMYVCMYVMYVCMYACMYVMYVCMYLQLRETDCPLSASQVYRSESMRQAMSRKLCEVSRWGWMWAAMCPDVFQICPDEAGSESPRCAPDVPQMCSGGAPLGWWCVRIFFGGGNGPLGDPINGVFWG